MEDAKTVAKFNTADDLKLMLAKEHMKQIKNFFTDEDRAMRFMSSVMAAVQRTPKLLECTPTSLINSFMIMAQLRLMPSGVSGEAYVIPYGGVAQFQLGYQGLVTLFYRAGIKKLVSEIVRENDVFGMVNGELSHEIDLTKSMEQRGTPVGAYTRFTLPSDETVTKYMNHEDIIAHAKRFSKAFTKPDSPWNAKNDPELWMWKKTTLIQGAKLVPKSDEIAHAMTEDNKDSVIGDRLEAAQDIAPALTMGAVLKPSDEYAQAKETEGNAPSEGDTQTADDGEKS